ncbi:type IV toxin-antitoxin system AbiEi family antitoxin [Caballeronia sp. LjRoot29]|uniref:type IV toxin-antitoxin system AbiEi family antitoxin n=1 Tax=Caballeronia sp. LjRoot29 TaxID=3342315 RepID=UPI003ECC60B1
MPPTSNLSYSEQVVLAEACTAFQRATRGFKAKPANRAALVRGGSGALIDGAIRFDIGGKTFDMPVLLQVSASTTGIVTAQHRLFATGPDKPGRPLMLVTPYVTPARAEELIDRNVPFLDMAGNVFLNEPEATVMITRRPKPTAVLPNQSSRATTPKGLKAMFAIATHPGLVAKPYRTIATVSGVGLNTVSQAMDDLTTRRLVAETRGGDRIIPDRKRFVDEWVAQYPSRLRNKLGARRFSAVAPDWWRKFDFEEFNMRLGGEAGAEQLTHHLKAINVTIYTQGELTSDFMLRARLRPFEKGDVEILEAFWPPESFQAIGTNPPELVHPLLIYADLVATGESRNLSIALQIYDQHLAALQS